MNLVEKARSLMPGGVNSPVRAFKSVGMDPIFIDSAKGVILKDVNGKEYIDYISSWGPMILGHGREDLVAKAQEYLSEGITFGLPSKVEVEMAEFLTEAVGTEMIRMVNSGTEATMSALRLARGYTGRNKFIKFEGNYHGHSDALLVKSGSGALTFKVSTSAGVPPEVVADTLVCRYNDIDSVREAIENHPGEIAAVIIEPIAGNMGVVPAEKAFIQELRKLTEEAGILLIFDEVITGFRCRFGSVKADFGIEPDLYCFGKIIGGGLPVGAFAGSREIMSYLSPTGNVYQAGTLSGNPLAMKMGLDVLRVLQENPEIYTSLEAKAKRLQEGFEENIAATGVAAKVVRYRSMLSLFFGHFPGDIRSYDDVKNADTEQYAKYFRAMFEQGFIFGPAQFEGIFISEAHSDEIIEKTIQANRKALEAL